jgi:hypothetical protein
MIYGYARVSTDGQSVTAQVAELRHGAGKVFREVASGAKTDRTQLRRVLDQLDAGDVLMVTRLDRLARSTRDPVELDADCPRRAGGVREGFNPHANRRRTGTRQGAASGSVESRNLPKTRSEKRFAAATATASPCARLPAPTTSATAR